MGVNELRNLKNKKLFMAILTEIKIQKIKVKYTKKIVWVKLDKNIEDYFSPTSP